MANSFHGNPYNHLQVARLACIRQLNQPLHHLEFFGQIMCRSEQNSAFSLFKKTKNCFSELGLVLVSCLGICMIRRMVLLCLHHQAVMSRSSLDARTAMMVIIGVGTTGNRQLFAYFGL